jgi:hypothetical protein
VPFLVRASPRLCPNGPALGRARGQGAGSRIELTDRTGGADPRRRAAPLDQASAISLRRPGRHRGRRMGPQPAPARRAGGSGKQIAQRTEKRTTAAPLSAAGRCAAVGGLNARACRTSNGVGRTRRRQQWNGVAAHAESRRARPASTLAAPWSVERRRRRPLQPR